MVTKDGLWSHWGEWELLWSCTASSSAMSCCNSRECCLERDLWDHPQSSCMFRLIRSVQSSMGDLPQPQCCLLPHHWLQGLSHPCLEWPLPAAPPGAQGHGGDTGDNPLHELGQHTAKHFPWGCPRLSVVSADKAPAPFPPPPQSGEGLLCQTPPRAPAPTNSGSGWAHQDAVSQQQVQELGTTQDHQPWPQPLHSLTARHLPNFYSP